MVRRRRDRLDQIGRHEPRLDGRIGGDLLAQQASGQGAALFDTHHDERPAPVQVKQKIGERRAHVPVGELARLDRVVEQGQGGVEAGLAIARREHPPGAGERRGVVGQHHPRQHRRGLGVADRPIPVLAPVEGGGVDEEHVGRRVAGGEVSGGQGPRRSQGIVRRGRRLVDRVRHLGIQQGFENVVAPDQHSGERQDGEAAPHDRQPELQSLEPGHGASDTTVAAPSRGGAYRRLTWTSGVRTCSGLNPRPIMRAGMRRSAGNRLSALKGHGAAALVPRRSVGPITRR